MRQKHKRKHCGNSSAECSSLVWARSSSAQPESPGITHAGNNLRNDSSRTTEKRHNSCLLNLCFVNTVGDFVIDVQTVNTRYYASVRYIFNQAVLQPCSKF